MEKITDSGWSNAVEIFINTLSEELRNLDGLDEIESKKIVTQGLRDYLEKNLRNYYSEKGMVPFENINKRFSNKIKYISPVFIKKFIRNRILSNHYYDRSGYLKKTSPYYYELRSALNNIKELREKNENKTV